MIHIEKVGTVGDAVRVDCRMEGTESEIISEATAILKGLYTNLCRVHGREEADKVMVLVGRQAVDDDSPYIRDFVEAEGGELN